MERASIGLWEILVGMWNPTYIYILERGPRGLRVLGNM